jgi:hypothetical protein
MLSKSEERQNRDCREDFLDNFLLCSRESLVQQRKLAQEEALLRILDSLLEEESPFIGHLYSQFIQLRGLQENGESRAFLKKALKVEVSNSETALVDPRKDRAVQALTFLKKEQDANKGVSARGALLPLQQWQVSLTQELNLPLPPAVF